MQDAVDKGATVVVGGQRADGPGWFYPPTLLTGITPEMDCTARRSSARSPRSTRVADLDEAIEIANSHPYGLGSNLWSEDEGERARFVRDIEAGMAFVNGMTTRYPRAAVRRRASRAATAAS